MEETLSCLVTGGAGFIGHNLVYKLLSEGREVVCLDKDLHGNWHPDSKNYVGSINNVPLLTEVINRYKIDTIFHMAAEANIQISLKDPIHTTRQNILGTTRVLQTAKECGVERVIFSSTCAVYECNHLIQCERSSTSPTLNPYALTKHCGEQLCEYYNNDLNVNTFRYFNVYGNGHRVDGAYPPVIAIFMDRYRKGLPLEIVGTGEQKRDFINVSDVVRANIMMADSDIKGGIYNVGSGVNYSVKEIANMISENQIHVQERKGEVLSTLANIHKIKNELKWSPETSVGDWINEQMDNYKL